MKSACCNLSNKQVFSILLGLFFGIWLFYVGISKWIGFGPTAFVGFIQQEFAQTWLPGWSVTLTAWIILIAEPLIGLLLVCSLGRCRFTWFLASLLMFMLLTGKTVLQDHATVANIWQYLVLALAGLYFAEKSCCLGKSACCDSTEKNSCCSEKAESSCCSK